MLRSVGRPARWRRRALTAALALLTAGPVAAADWGGIVPGTSTMQTVQARYGTPTRQSAQTVEGYETVRWIYEGAQAPAGFTRLTVDFGLLGPAGYRRDLVRTFTLEPKPNIFTRAAVLDGWGRPSGAKREGETVSFFYDEGLIVYFDKDGWAVRSMVFTLPQPTPPEAAPPR
ncbi:MAG TPA: hypothetical protein VNK50_12235 [Calidithermus sp.]|jgi:hypothetical protein|nr:hypothetical protein [Calidithermus sp.]